MALYSLLHCCPVAAVGWQSFLHLHSTPQDAENSYSAVEKARLENDVVAVVGGVPCGYAAAAAGIHYDAADGGALLLCLPLAARLPLPPLQTHTQ